MEYRRAQFRAHSASLEGGDSAGKEREMALVVHIHSAQGDIPLRYLSILENPPREM